MKVNSLDIIKQHIIKTLTFYNLSRKNKSLRAELGKIHSLADKLSKNNSWISVDDELPDIDSKYLVYSTQTEVIELVDKSQLFAMINNSYKITHWQPLPEPPKE